MVQAINPISAEMRLAQLLGEDQIFAQAPVPTDMSAGAGSVSRPLSGNAFEDMLAKAVEALEGVSKSEVTANQLVDKYIHGEAELQDVMVAQSKMSIMVNLAVTTVNSAVNTFKEITQIQV